MRKKNKNTHAIGIDGRRVRIRNLRTYNRTIEFLRGGSGTLSEIMDFVNNYVQKNGRITQSSTTRTQLSNILSKYPAFCKVGTTRSRGSYRFRGTYEVAIWALSDEVNADSDVSEN